jgi:cyclin-dependent kinase 7
VKTRRVGEGTFAVVYEGIDTSKTPAQRVALKKLKFVREASGLPSGLDISSIRELKALRLLTATRHPFLTPLLDVWLPAPGRKDSSLHLVLPFYDWDLAAVISDHSLLFQPGDVKAWLWMLLSGLECCHAHDIIHRDLKPGNVLVDARTGELKLADFGLARAFAFPSGLDGAMTPRVVTRWYRAPELLMGARIYGAAVDVWAVGCIFAELLLRTPFLPGDSDLNQLLTTFRALGTPSVADWPEMTQLPDYVPVALGTAGPPLQSIFSAASDDALDLLARMLALNPSRRITARDALQHSYFTSHPPLTPSAQLPRPGQGSRREKAAAQGVPSELQPRKLEFSK